MPYQNFWNRKGGSDSSGKLQALKLPNLEGKSLLDIGCNEGFFCMEAKKRGAARVVGIDRGAEFIEAAKKRAPEIDFRCQTWETLPEGPFLLADFLAQHKVADLQEMWGFWENGARPPSRKQERARAA